MRNKNRFIDYLYKPQPPLDPKIIFITLACVTIFGCFIQSYVTIGKTLENTKSDLASTTQILNTLRDNFSSIQKQNSALLGQLTDAQIQNTFYGQQIDTLNSTVGQLYKLSQTDKELLQKYSRVYFLNENYVPSQLSLMDSQYLFNKNTSVQIHTNVKSYLENLLNVAQSNGISLSVLSGYRSFGTQTTLKTSYKVTYGTTAANSFSADQGYSEHQLGSAIDFTNPIAGNALTGFEKTPAYTWLLDNAYKYGFILSYPKGNKYYVFEPWHWRFVGVALATKLHDEHINFYDMDQRTIDSYLINIFD